MTTPPTPEAVEAAIKYATFKEYSAADFAALNDHLQDPCEPTIGTAARILAAEVERLRADLEECRGFHRDLIKKHAPYGDENLKLRVENEELRAELAQAKRDSENATCKTGNP